MRLSLAAEWLKLRRQRQALFWGFVFVPVFALVIGFALGGGLRESAAGVTVEAIQPLRAIARAFAGGGNSVAQLFFAIGAAAIFAVEYRHSGWRHLVPRASRESLLASKFALYALAAAFSLLLLAAGELLATVLPPLIRGMAIAVKDAPGAGGVAILSFLLGYAELLGLGALVLLLAVVTRSAMAAILVPFLLALGSTLLQAYLGARMGTVPLPVFAAGAVRDWLSTTAPTPDLARAALIGAATLAAWIAAPLAAAFAVFARQDLVSE